MLQKFQQHIEINFPFFKDKKLLIAVSGGLDSVVLTHLLHKLNYSISLAHCNFQLRENDSDIDEAFVSDLGYKLNIQTFKIRFDTENYSKENKLSTQLAARKLRYDWFDELVKKHSFDYVLTAHHADDNLETFLINLTRGTGLEGLTGIPVQNGNIIRPLLIFSREAILNHAKESNIEWREDASNFTTKYLRNKIRHEVVPILKEINPSLLDSFAKTSEHLQQSQQIVDDRIKNISEKIVTKENSTLQFDTKKILKLSNPKAYLYQLLKNYNFGEWDKVFNLLYAQTGKFLLTKSHILLKNRDFLLFSPADSVDLISNKIYYIDNDSTKINAPIKLSIENTIENKVDDKKSILVDKNLVFYPLILRKWKNGDIFYPRGMTGKKKISKYFKDEKLSLIDKQNTWLLCTKDDQIIWIIGLRQDKRFTINNNTENKIKISIT